MKSSWRYSQFKKTQLNDKFGSYREYLDYTKIDCKRVQKESWYKEYVSQFIVPVDFKYTGSDWHDMTDTNSKLLLQLVASSHSTTYRFVLPNFSEKDYVLGTSTPDLEIIVKNDNIYVTRLIKNLFGFQIANLINVYINEQISYFLLFNQIGSNLGNDPKMESEKIAQFRKENLELFQLNMNHIMSRIERNKILFDALN